MVGPSVEGVFTICSNCSALLNEMAAMPIYGNTFETLICQNQKKKKKKKKKKNYKTHTHTQKALRLNLIYSIGDSRSII